MALLNAAIAQAKGWLQFTRLDGPDAERDRAIEALCALGDAARPIVGFAIKQNEVRVQFAAAIVLHRLGDPAGLDTLVGVLRWKLATTPALAPELEAALIRIGPPEAVRALITLWSQITDWSEQNPVPACICRVWTAIRDPRPLDALIQRATTVPALFLATVPEFGQMAIVHLERMVRDADPARRIVALQALSRIPHQGSFAVVAPLLRDRDPSVRAAVPDALAALGSPNTVSVTLTEAALAGFSSPAAIEMLERLDAPNLYGILTDIISRWEPRSAATSGDSGESVLACLTILAREPFPAERIVPPICSLVKRRPDAAILAAAARLLSRCHQVDYGPDVMVQDSLLPLVAHIDADVREQATLALDAYGAPVARYVAELIEQCRPQESIFDRLQTFLRGGSDAGQLATQTVRQVTQWFSRVSREAAERIASGKFAQPLPGADPQIPPLLAELLTNALDALQFPANEEQTRELIALSVAALRAIARVGAPASPGGRRAILRALQFTRPGSVPQMAWAPGERSVQDFGTIVRLEAADTLRQIYGGASFAFLMESAFAFDLTVRETAVVALGRLGDIRALPLLQSLATRSDSTLSLAAQDALAAIRRTNPEAMTLLRPSYRTDAHPETLLRPATDRATSSPDTLLRPSEAASPSETTSQRAVPET